jgi:hypothetical protein
MSHASAHDDAAHIDADEVNSAAAEAHDEPVPEEPKTPLWLTALGAALFFVLAVVWLVGALARETGSAEASAASAAASAPAAPPPTPKAPPPLPTPPPPPIAAAPPPIPATPPPIPPPGGAKNVKKAAKPAPGNNP